MRRYLVLLLLAGMVFVSGCLPGIPGSRQQTTQTTQPKVYVTPCRILENNTMLMVTSNGINEKQVGAALVDYYPDDFSTPGVNINSTYSMKCHWAYKVGETERRLYCDGKYKAPEFDEFKVIKRYVWKEFTIGFNVEEHVLGTWVEESGVKHENERVYYLRVSELKSTCYVA
ncbi:MAG: hypothetical protein NTU61_04090 [Candidatus Altiarchaeota archaeon]|nr:hypothetical protein [Candidatus Altiarchaeota archaeon]